MASLPVNLTFGTRIAGIGITALGVNFSVVFSRPDGSDISAGNYQILFADKSLRDVRGNVLYPDVTVFALGILADVTNLVAKINTLHLQSITDAKVQP